MKKMSSAVLAAVLAAFLAVPCFAARPTESSVTPQDLEDLRIGLQDQIDALVIRIENVEVWISDNESTINELQQWNLDLSGILQRLEDIETNIGETNPGDPSIRQEINALKQENIALRAQMSSDPDAITTPLQDQIAINNEIIALLGKAITGNVDMESIKTSLNAIETGLQEQIDDNFSSIGDLEARIAIAEQELVWKQNLVNGECLDGSAIRKINDDGSVVCSTVSTGTGTSVQLNVTMVNSLKAGMPYTGTTPIRIPSTCETGQIVTEVGFYVSPNCPTTVKLVSASRGSGAQYSDPERVGVLQVINTGSDAANCDIWNKTMCTSIVPSP